MSIGSGMTGDAFVGDALVGGDAPSAAGQFEGPVAQGDMVLSPSPAPNDIVLDTKEGGNSLNIGSGGRSTVTFGLGVNPALISPAAGVSTVESTTGAKFATIATTAGVAKVEPNRLIVILATDYVTIYPSVPPFESHDVLIATVDGPVAGDRGNTSMVGGFWIGFDMLGNDTQPAVEPPEAGAMFAFTTSRATCTFTQNFVAGMRMVSSGRAAVTARESTTFAVFATSAGRGAMVSYLGTPIRQEATSNGKAGARNPVNTTQSWYLGSSTRMEATSNGKGGARDQFGAAGKWYLGSTIRVAITSNGRATATTYLASPVLMTATSAGKATHTVYLGSPFRVASTSAGRAVVLTYLASPVAFSLTSRGRAASTQYLASRIYFDTTFSGFGGGSNYLGSPVRSITTSRGVAGGSSRLGGTFLLPNITMRGVANWTLGETFIFGIAKGEGRMGNLHLAGTQRQAFTSRGIGVLRDNDRLLVMTSNGSARNTEFDKPPFAFVCNAGCNAFDGVGYRSQNNPYINVNRGSSNNVGVFMYLSSRIGFANDDPTRHHITSFGAGSGPSRMAGTSTFTFPYEMVAISNAGCRAFTTYRSNQAPEFGVNFSGAPGGVFARQTSPDYMSALARSYSTPPQLVFAYLSSRVYQDIESNGRSTMRQDRKDEADFNGVGGGDITLGADNRQIAAQSNGKGGWANNFLPDIRLLGTVMRGVGRMQTYQSGNVQFGIVDEFGNGIFQAHGIGTMELSPTLFETTMRGVGRMLNIPRPDQVSMEWGKGEFFYVDPDNFPVTDPLLIPKSSSGIAHMEIEIDTIPIMRQRIDGVGRLLGSGLEGILKGVRSQDCNAGCYDWFESTQANPILGISSVRRPGLPQFVSPTDPRYHKQGVEAAFPVQEVLIAFDGVGAFRASMRMAYVLRWQNHFRTGSGVAGSRPYTSNDYALDENGGVVGLPFGTGNVGGIGRAVLEGDRRLALVSRGRANIGIRLDASGIFAANLFANGISTFLNNIGGGTPPLDRYGNMLRYFFIPIPTYGQFWPRRESPTQPV